MKKLISIAIIFLGVLQFASAQTGTWSGKIEAQGVQLSLVFHLNEEGPTMDSPDQGVKGIPVEVKKDMVGKVSIEIPSIGGTYEGLWTGKQIVGTFRQLGTSFPLTLKPGEVKRNRPQTPVAPFPYTTEEVSFENGDAILKGTLVLPEGYSDQTPVLIMVTGSGFQNRDEEIYEHKPFAVIADALARAGVATLRYDDRGFGESTGDIVNCTTEDLKNDAVAGIALLRQRFGKVGVIGHSEGGTIAMMLAAEKKVDFVVSLAGNIVSGAETLLWQNELALSAAGFSETVVKSYCKLLGEAFDACLAGTPMPSAERYDLPEALSQNYVAATMQLRTPYMQYFLGMDVRPILKDVTCPVLAFNGTKDKQVSCDNNLEELRRALPSNPKNRIESVEGVNHLFQHCTSGETTEYGEIEETFAKEVLVVMAEWLSAFK